MYRDILQQAVGFLRRSQLRGGNFPTLISKDPDFKEEVSVRRTIFTTALILDALGDVHLPGSDEIKDRASDFLLQERSGHWSWNYWEKAEPASVQAPYPDDLDDTVVALAGLCRSDVGAVDAAVMAHVVKLLIAAEIQPGGPYRTWLARDYGSLSPEPDPAVNANIAYFLGLRSIALPGLDGYLRGIIEAGNYRSPYYASTYPVVYFLARGCRGKKAGLVNFLKQYPPKHALDRALAASIWLDLGYRDRAGPLVEALCGSQRADGGWPAFPFWVDHIDADEPSHAGSEALTTALAMQAIWNYARKHEQSSSAPMLPQEDRFRESVIGRARARAAELPAELGKDMLQLLDNVVAEDQSGQITLLPLWWRDALREGHGISERKVSALALANLWGWLGYAAADGVMDLGERRFVPLASCALRECDLLYAQLFAGEEEGDLFRNMMARMDNANLNEIKEGTPSSNDPAALAEKSIGHAIGPLLMLLWSGHGPNSSEFGAAIEFFTCYLAARQLNDDAHDWEEDLARGRLNPVGALLCPDGIVPAKEDIRALRQGFWERKVVEVAGTIDGFLKRGRRALAALPLKDSGRFEGLLSGLENATYRAVQESRDTLRFLAAYKS